RRSVDEYAAEQDAWLQSLEEAGTGSDAGRRAQLEVVRRWKRDLSAKLASYEFSFIVRLAQDRGRMEGPPPSPAIDEIDVEQARGAFGRIVRDPIEAYVRKKLEDPLGP